MFRSVGQERWPLSCQETESLDLCRKKGVNDEDYGLGATVKVQLLGEKERDMKVKNTSKIIRLLLTCFTTHNLCLRTTEVEKHHAYAIV